MIGGVVGAWIAADNINSAWELRITEQKLEAASMLRAAEHRAAEAERREISRSRELEARHAKEKVRLDAAVADGMRVAAAAGGLRDPGRGRGGSVTGAKKSGAAKCSTDSPSSGKLSPEATRFLFEFAREADTVANYARLCHAWVVDD